MDDFFLPSWHTLVMYDRMRLLLSEPYPNVEELMREIIDLVLDGHWIAGAMAQRVGIEILTNGRYLPCDIKRARFLCSQKTFTQGMQNDVNCAIVEIEEFLAYVEMKSKKKPYWMRA